MPSRISCSDAMTSGTRTRRHDHLEDQGSSEDHVLAAGDHSDEARTLAGRQGGQLLAPGLHLLLADRRMMQPFLVVRRRSAI